MLRAVLLVLSAILVAVSLVGFVIAGWPAIGPLVFGSVLLLSLLFERYVYKPIRTGAPGPGWSKTGERFADPRSGGNVSVYFNPRTGERRYVADMDG